MIVKEIIPVEWTFLLRRLVPFSKREFLTNLYFPSCFHRNEKTKTCAMTMVNVRQVIRRFRRNRTSSRSRVRWEAQGHLHSPFVPPSSTSSIASRTTQKLSTLLYLQSFTIKISTPTTFNRNNNEKCFEEMFLAERFRRKNYILRFFIKRGKHLIRAFFFFIVKWLFRRSTARQ